MGKTCALTGHRDLPFDFDKKALCDALEKLILDGYDRFLGGMARGFDLVAFECLVHLKKKYPISFIACIPFAGQSNKMSLEERKLYKKVLDACDEKKVLFERYETGCFLVRDRYMVDRADLVFAYCTRETGGTAYTVDYAKRKGIRVVYLGR